jgi:hypothetical protein
MTEKARSLSPHLTFLGLYIATPSLEASPKKVKVQIKVLIYPTRPWYEETLKLHLLCELPTSKGWKLFVGKKFT